MLSISDLARHTGIGEQRGDLTSDTVVATLAAIARPHADVLSQDVTVTVN
jgi:hypothetical protein